MKRYLKIDNNKTETGKRYIANAIYPRIPETEQDIYVIATAGDRYDTLALEYYKDPQLWWVIASVNNSKRDSLVVEPGKQLRIPSDIQAIKDEYRELNNNR